MKALVVSQKFNYGHISGLQAWYDMLVKLGYETSFLLDEQYFPHLDGHYGRASLKEATENDYFLIVIFNISIKDGAFVSRVKKKHKQTKIIFNYHEPWRGLKNEIRRFGKDLWHLFKQIARKAFAIKLLKKTNLVICPSEEAASFYKQHEIKINPNFTVFPLVFLDSSRGLFKYNKRFFSFISTATLDKGADLFFSFAKYASRIDGNILFQVITSSNVDKYIDSEIRLLINQGRFVIKQKKGLSESEMDRAYDDSACTWLVYRSSTQSGVVAKALMWGSPCLATKVGVFPNVIDGQNGFLVEAVDDFNDIYKKYSLIMSSLTERVDAARKTFETIYSSVTRRKDLQDILDSLE